MAQIAISTTTEGLRTTDADWGEIRRTTIAAHETPALFETIAEMAGDDEEREEFQTEDGAPVSAYSSPLALWEMKTGRYSEAGSRKRGLWSRIKWGVMTAALEERGIEMRRPAGVYVHPQHDFMSSRIDNEASEDGGATWVPVISFNVAGTMTDQWRNATGEWTAPEYVHIQAQHHMACTGAEKVFVVALFGGITVRFFVIERDEELVEDIVGAICDFWALVEQDKQPRHSGARDVQVLNRICSRINPTGRVIDKRKDKTFLSLIEKKKAKAAQKGALEKEIKEINALLAVEMDGVESALISDTQQYVWIRTPEAVIPETTRSASAYLREKKVSPKASGDPINQLLER